MPVISVVVPAYNAEKTIKNTIQSVQQQTFNDFEIIVIDNGSIDNTKKVLYSIEDPRLKVLSYSRNIRVCGARNSGMYHSTGEFIAFLDADDLWTPDKLELQLKALKQHPEAGVSYSWTCFMDVNEKGEPLSFYPTSQSYFQGNVYKHLLIQNFIHNGSNTLIRKQVIDAVGEFDTSLIACEDWDYWLRIAAHSNFVVIPKYQILYRRAPGTLSSNIDKVQAGSQMVIEKAYRAAPPEFQSLKNQTFASLHHYYAELYLRHTTDIYGTNQAGKNLWNTVYLHPKNLFNYHIQRSIVKFILRKTFPPRLATRLIQFFSKVRTTSDPRLQFAKSLLLT
jgi:glycosyltransferase involved in cell wall biosynthesis